MEKTKIYELAIFIQAGKSIPVMNVSLTGPDGEIKELKEMHKLQIRDVMQNACKLIEKEGQEITGMSEIRQREWLTEKIIVHFSAK